MSNKLKFIMFFSVTVLIVGIAIGGVWFAKSSSNSSQIANQPSVSSPTTPDTSTSPPEGSVPSDDTSINKINAGDVFVVAISANDISDMYGYQLCVNYNKTLFEYSGNLISDIAEINLIFKSHLEFDNYILVGASKTGTQSGFNGKNVQICHMTFTAIKDCELVDISISDVKVVGTLDSGLTNINNWNCEILIA